MATAPSSAAQFMISLLTAVRQVTGGRPPPTWAKVDKVQQKLSILLEVSKELGRSVDTDGILQKIVEQAYQILTVDRVAIQLMDENGALVTKIARDKRGAEQQRTVPQSIARAAIADKVAILSDNAGEDSVSLLPALGVTKGPTREGLVVHSANGFFGVREGKWKLCLCPGSGGWSEPRPGKEPADAPAVQLFDLDKDIGEKTNLQGEHPEVVERLTKQLQKWIDDGRSTPGKPQKNTTPVVIRKK